MHGSRRFPFWAALILVAAPAPARAQDGDTDSIPDPEPPLDGPHDPFGLGFKKFAYSVAVKAAEVYDDNLFLTPDDPVSDTITVLLLTAKTRYDFGPGAVTAGYRGRERIFSKHDELNGPEHFVDVAGDLEAGDWRFDAGLEYRAMKDPFDALQVTERVDSDFDREFLKAAAVWGPFGLELNGARSRFAVDDEVLDRGDYLRYEGGITGLAAASPKVHFFLSVGGWTTRYDEAVFSDFDVVQVLAGARIETSTRTRLEAGAGYARAEPEGDPTAVPFEDFSEIVGHLAGIWAPVERHEVAVTLRREPVESVNSGLALSDEVRLGYKYVVRDQGEAGVSFYWERRRESFSHDVRIGVGVRAGAQWDLGRRLFTDGGVLLRSRNGEDPDEDYDNFRVSLGLGARW